MKRILTLDEFILQRQKDFKHASGELTALLRDIGVATKIINNAINKIDAKETTVPPAAAKPYF